MSARLRAVEVAAWSAGILLLSVYGGARYWSVLARDEAVSAFNAARDAPMYASVAKRRVGDSGVAAGQTDGVDTSTWSASRVEAYRNAAARAVAAEAVLRIPRIKLLVPVFGDTSELNLNRGAGRIEGTAPLGESGNLGIAAHRDGFFRALKDVRIGDALYLDQPAATDVYTVVETRIVEPSDIGVLRDTGVPTITLVTCYPFYFVGSAPKRFIVRAQIASR